MRGTINETTLDTAEDGEDIPAPPAELKRRDDGRDAGPDDNGR